MLKRAILYKNQFSSLFTEIADNPHYRFLTTIYCEFDKIIDVNNWAKQQFVSLDKSDNIIGYFEADIVAKPHFVRNLVIVRFKRESRYDITFAKDLNEFFLRLFLFYRYRKIVFTVAIGSPNEIWYDKLIERYGGRIVGIKRENFMLENGVLLDEKIYEIFRNDFENKFCVLHPKLYRKCISKFTLAKGI